MKVFLTRPVYNTPLVTEKLKAMGIELICPEQDVICPMDVLKQYMALADGFITHTEDTIDANLLSYASNKLKIIANCGIGFSNIDVDAAREKGITVTNTLVEEAFDATVEATVALVVSIARRIPALHVERSSLDADPESSFLRPTAVSIRSKTTGIIGLGRIGVRVAKMMHQGFNNQILYYDLFSNEEAEKSLRAKQVSLDKLMAESDFVCVNMPLSEKSKGLVSAKHIGLLKDSATFINTARAGLIDETALINRANAGKLHGIGLDVYSPQVNQITFDNCALTSHFANFENEAYTAMSQLIVDNVIGVLKDNKPITAVN